MKRFAPAVLAALVLAGGVLASGSLISGGSGGPNSPAAGWTSDGAFTRTGQVAQAAALDAGAALFSGAVTLTPGPLRVGAGGLSVDGGVRIMNVAGQGNSSLEVYNAGGIIGGYICLGSSGAGTCYFPIHHSSATESITVGQPNSVTTKLIDASNAGFFTKQGTSSAASGANGWSLTTNGARIDFGAGANDYASSDGSIVSFAGPIKSGGSVTTADNNFSCSLSTTPCYHAGSISAASASSTVPVHMMWTPTTLDANDLVFGVGQGGSSTVEVFTVDNEGDAVATGSITSNSALTKGTITLAAGTGTATVISGAKCVCGTETANPVRCAVVTTTLTCTGTGTELCNYVCL